MARFIHYNENRNKKCGESKRANEQHFKQLALAKIKLSTVVGVPSPWSFVAGPISSSTSPTPGR